MAAILLTKSTALSIFKFRSSVVGKPGYFAGRVRKPWFFLHVFLVGVGWYGNEHA